MLISRFRGTRQFQENVQFPLLYLIATWEDQPFVRGELEERFILPLADLYGVTEEDLQVRLPGHIADVCVDAERIRVLRV